MHAANDRPTKGVTAFARRLALAALLALAPTTPAQPKAQTPSTPPAPAKLGEPAQATTVRRQFAIELAGSPAGSMTETLTTAPDELRTRSEMSLTIRRGETVIRLRQSTEFVESPTFEPRSATAVNELGAGPVRTTMVFSPAGIEITTEQQGRSTTSRAPSPEGVWLTPRAAKDYVARRLRAGADSIKLRTIDPSVGAEPITLERTKIVPGTLEVAEGSEKRTIEGFWCDSRTSVEPNLVSREFLTAEGDVLRTDSTIGELALRMTFTPGASAPAEVDPARAPEMMVATFVKPDRVIAGPRTLQRGVYLLSIKDHAPGQANPLEALASAGAQRVEHLADGRVRVTVDLKLAATENAQSTPDDLAPSAFCDTTDDKVRVLADSVRAPSRAELAEALRRRVFSHLRDKNLATGFGTASEAARSRAGDCTEHAVLLCAMLRARDIPARVVSGLIYADQFAGENDVFGYHMWTRALLETDAGPRWVDLDATLPPAKAFDATHIALQEPDLRDGKAMTSLAGLVNILGRLEIRVETP
jgi:transglutaminase-like putative cysteine protease